MSPVPNVHGHLRIYLCRGGIKVKRYVHRLVLEAFVGPCPEGMECLHADGNAGNNRLGNLRWGTPLENQADKIRHGTTNRGNRHPLAKLREADIPEIFAIRRANPSLTYDDIGILYGVKGRTIGQVIRRTNWWWVEIPEAVALG